MGSRVPPHLREKGAAVEEMIRRAFKGVTRDGGISWSGSLVVDRYGSDAEIKAAAAFDTEPNWEALIDDPAWDHEMGMGGFNFVDPIGFRYYIAPAIIRCAHEGYGEATCYALTIDSDFNRRMIREITPDQSRAIARFFRYMIEVDAADPVELRRDSDWRHAYERYWRQFDDDAP